MIIVIIMFYYLLWNTTPIFSFLNVMCFELTDEEQKIGFNEVDLALADSLNAEQKDGFDQILAHVNSGKGKFFLLMVLVELARHIST